MGALRAKCWACFQGLESLSDAGLKTLAFVMQELRRVRQSGGTVLRVAGLRTHVAPTTALFATYTIHGAYPSP